MSIYSFGELAELNLPFAAKYETYAAVKPRSRNREGQWGFLTLNMFIQPLFGYDVLRVCDAPPTSVAGDEADGVPFRLFDYHIQRGRAGHQYGHMTGRPGQFWCRTFKQSTVQNTIIMICSGFLICFIS